MKILIADDHEIVRKGLRELLAREFNDAAFGEAANAEQALRQVEEDDDWDVMLLDLTLPGRSGLDLLRDVKLLRSKLPVLILSMHPESQYGKRVLKAGAAGYMNKDTTPAELAGAVRKVVSGRCYVSHELAERLALDLSSDSEQVPHERLSDRELEVLTMIASGKTISNIAEELHLSITTVSTYRARILEKMGLKTTAELIHYGLRNHLLQ